MFISLISRLKKIPNLIHNPYFQKLLLLYISFFCLSLIYTFPVRRLLISDESGYIGRARKIVYGYDFGKLSDTVYPGYSILLVPIFLFTDDISTAYIYIHVINALIYACFPVVSMILLTCIAPKINNKIKVLLASVLSLYPFYLLYSVFAMPDNLLALLYLILSIVIYKLITEFKQFKWWILSLVVFVLMVVVHPRGLFIFPGLMFVYLLILIMNMKQGNQKAKYGLIIFFIFMLLGIGSIYYLLQNSGDYNKDFSDILNNIFGVHLLVDKFQYMIGRYLYLLISTFGLFGLSIYYLLAKIIGNKFKFIKSQDFVVLWFVFLLLNLLVVLIYSSTPHEIDYVRSDLVIYGRYLEVIIMPVLLAGSVFFLKEIKKINKKMYIFLLLSFISTSLIIYISKGHYFVLLNDLEISIIGVAIYKYFEIFDNYFLTAVIFSFLVILLALMHSIKTKINYFLIIGVFFILVHFILFFGYIKPKISQLTSPVVQYLSHDLIWNVLRNDEVLQIDLIRPHLDLDLLYYIYQTELPEFRFVVRSTADQQTQAQFIFADYDIRSEYPHAQIAALENNEDSILWVVSDQFKSKLSNKGLLLPENYLSDYQLPKQAYQSDIQFHLDQFQLSKNLKLTIPVTITHTGQKAFWPNLNQLDRNQGYVALALDYVDVNSKEKIDFDTNYMHLKTSLYPGQSVKQNLTLTLPHQYIRPINGKYLVIAYLVQAKVTDFPEQGDKVYKFYIIVESETIRLEPYEE